MNEQVDILLTSAKLASRNNPWASIATHAISSGYNAAMIGKYRYDLGLVKAGVSSYSSDQTQTFQRDLVKLCFMESFDILALFIGSVSRL